MEDKIYWVFILALPVSCIAWTVTKEQIFKEAQVFFSNRSEKSRHILVRKICYMFTCEYCFSHYVTILLLIITQYKLLYPDWRGYLISGFAMVWIANVYMSLYNIIRIDLKKEKIIARQQENKLKSDKIIITDQHS